jgi:hypothetical protein
MRKEYMEMRKYFPIYEEAVSHIWLCSCSILNFLIYEENLIFFFISAKGKSPKAIKLWCYALGLRKAIEKDINL